MATYVGFLRAINLGAKRKFPKDAIVRATEAAGFTDVATYINTGNVRFDTTLRSRAKIEAALEEAYRAEAGFEVPTIVFTTKELRGDRRARRADVRRRASGTTSRCSRSRRARPRSRRWRRRAPPTEVAKVGGRAVHLLYHGSSYGSDARLTNVAGREAARGRDQPQPDGGQCTG